MAMRLMFPGRGLALIAALLAGCGGSGGEVPTAVAPAPVATTAADVVVVDWNQPAAVNVLANDSVSNGGTLSIVSVTQPSHGTAAINGSSVVYTPASGYFGKDSFSYSAKGAATDTGMSTAAVALTVKAKMTLQGKVTDGPLPNAIVTAQVGTQTFTATADASGNYSLPIASDSPDNFVVLKAQGVGAQSNVVLASIAGDSRTLASATKADGTIAAAALPAANITNVSTASYAQIVQLNSGAPPTTQAALDTALAMVDSDALVQTAAVIKLLVDGSPGISLPAGTASAFELVNNKAAYNAFAANVVATAPAALAAAKTAVLGDTALSAISAAAVIVPTAKVYYLGKQCCVGSAMEVLVNPDGTAVVTDYAGKHAAQWTATTGPNVLVYATPVSQEAADAPAPDGTQANIIIKTTGIRIRQLIGTENAGVAGVDSIGIISYPNHEQPDRPLSSADGYSLAYSFKNASLVNAPGVAELAGHTIAGFPELNYSLNPNQISLSFSADGTAKSDQLFGTAITWAVTNGKLVVNYADGTRQIAARIASAADGEQHWVVRTLKTSGDEFFAGAMMVDVTSASFSSTNPVARWLSHINAGVIEDSNFYVNVMTGNVGSQESQSLDGTVSGQPFSWVVDSSGKLIMTTYRLPSGFSLVASCPSGVNCTVHKRRTWTVLRQSDRSIFVLEKVEFPGFGSIPPIIRVNRYDGS